VVIDVANLPGVFLAQPGEIRFRQYVGTCHAELLAC
jgi:hypothetical protein